MKKLILLFISISFLSVFSCKNEEPEFMPIIPLDINLNQELYQNGDSLFGKVTLDMSKAVSGTDIQKIDCRLGNIVIGESKNSTTCKFGVLLKDKPTGRHKLSVIIKCKAPDYDLTYLRYDFDMVNIANDTTN